MTEKVSTCWGTMRRRRSIATRTLCRARKGTAAVEMALVCPLVLLFAFATTDFGRVMAAYLVVCNAARVGADYGSTNGYTSFTRTSWETAIRQVVNQEMLGLSSYQPGQLQVSITATPDPDGLYHVTVEVSYPFTTVVNWPGVPSLVSLDHSVTARRIR
jgi:Flp pilus assembly protein TadG